MLPRPQLAIPTLMQDGRCSLIELLGARYSEGSQLLLQLTYGQCVGSKAHEEPQDARKLVTAI